MAASDTCRPAGFIHHLLAESGNLCFTRASPLWATTYKCHTCFVVQERHRNVLQYKESAYCGVLSSLDEVCGEIAGDAELHTLFRRSGTGMMASTPVECPFHGPFTFSYDRGGGVCEDPVSRVDACTKSSRLLFRFQACHSVRSESSEEELECLATWKDGSKTYLVGRMQQSSSSSSIAAAAADKDAFRCFLFDRDKAGHVVHLAQSGDASCSGVLSATDGARTLKLTKLSQNRMRNCSFPHWFTSSRNNGIGNKWHTLDGGTTFRTDGFGNTLHISGNEWDIGDSVMSVSSSSSSSSSSSIWLHQQQESRSLDTADRKVTCVERKESDTKDQDEHEVLILAYAVRGCAGVYLCMRFHLRDKHVVEIETGQPAKSPDFACGDYFFVSSRRKTTTLVAMSPKEMACPMVGRFAVLPPLTTREESAGGSQDHHPHHYSDQQDGLLHQQAPVGKAIRRRRRRRKRSRRRRRHNGDAISAAGAAESLLTFCPASMASAGGSSRATTSNAAISHVGGGGGGGGGGARPRHHGIDADHFLHHNNGEEDHRDNQQEYLGSKMDEMLPRFSSLHVGCRDNRRLELTAACQNAPDVITEYRCHGSWEDNGTQFLIVSPVSSSRDMVYLCLASRAITTQAMPSGTYGPTTAASWVANGYTGIAANGMSSSGAFGSGGITLVSYQTMSCEPPAITGIQSISFNVTLMGQCAQPLSSATSINKSPGSRGSSHHWLSSMMVIFGIMFLS
ncbi:unnamed protein product [Notodromas monacha]|uniref:Uncharacterized protein n=1 Tax=Notodromas monacha TaxID=399045 RepID=A0A7R9BSD4_9CRUS|nr:unnamed protein product [Notodromas monacha]CAG0920497.1 unnamed protein product [Notodromas monacha]